MSGGPSYTYAEQRECAERELRMRKSAYPRWVSQNKMTQTKADREIALMAAIVETLTDLSTTERLI